jgi:predicted aspartyl protease
LGREQGILADGSVHDFDVHRAMVVWDGQLRSVEVLAIDAPPLAGVGLFEHHSLRIDFVELDPWKSFR